MAWVRLDDAFPDHPKAERAGDQACWLYVCGLAYCNRVRTDGFIPRSRVPKLTGFGRPMKLASTLVSVGLWDETPDGFAVHDYLDFQPSAADLEERSETRSAAGKKGAAARWGSHGKPDGKSHRASHGKSMAKECPVPGPVEEGSNDPSLMRELCGLLADLVIANGRPKHLVDPGSRGWRNAARLMLDRDGRDPEEAKRLIQWCQADAFWRSNILSMPKFREKYDQLRLRAAKENGRAPSSSHHADEVEATRRRLEEAEV